MSTQIGAGVSDPKPPSEKGGKLIQFRSGPPPEATETHAIVTPSAIYKPNVEIPNAPPGFHEAFPLRGAFHTYAWWASQVTDAPAWFHAASILVAGTAELARRGWVIGPESRYIPRLWMAMVAGPGIGKSTAINLARDFYTDAGGVEGWPSPYVTAEGSTQGLFEALAKLKDDKTNLTTAILIKEEFSTLLNIKRRDDLSFALCEWADGNHHERHTRQLQRAKAEGGPGGEDRMTNAAISATFVTTKHALLEVATAQHLHGGLFSRFLWVPGSGQDVVPRMHPSRCADERAVAVAAWRRWHGWLDAMGLKNNGAKVIGVRPEVDNYLRETLFVDYENALKDDNLLTAHYKRGLGHASIIAGVFAMNEGRTVIETIDMHRAVNFLNLCLDNISQFAPEISTPSMRLANRAFNFIQRKGKNGVSRRQLYQHLQIAKRDLDSILETLVDEGSVTEQALVRTGKPGRPASYYVACAAGRFGGPVDDDEDDLDAPSASE